MNALPAGYVAFSDILVIEYQEQEQRGFLWCGMLEREEDKNGNGLSSTWRKG